MKYTVYIYSTLCENGMRTETSGLLYVCSSPQTVAYQPPEIDDG